MLTLVIAHNIALTKEERYSLVAGEVVNVVGVSLPVWHEKTKKGIRNSEPAHEVFVDYRLTNKEEDFPIKTTDTGYEINMPQPNPMLEAQLKSVNPEMLEVLGVQSEIPTFKSLLNVEDGGSAYLKFRQFNKSNLIVDGEKTKKGLYIVHTVEIRSVEELQSTLN